MPEIRLQAELSSLRRRHAAALARAGEADQVLEAIASILGATDAARVGETIFAAFRVLVAFDRGFVLSREAADAFRTRFATTGVGADACVSDPSLSRIAAGGASALPDARRALWLAPFLPEGDAPVSALMLPFSDRAGRTGLILLFSDGFGVYQAEEARRLKRFGVVAAQGLAAVDEMRLAREYDRAEREREVAREASLAKSRLLGRISHELRTPLNGVLGAAHLLKLKPMAEEARRLLDDIETCGRDMLRQVSDLIDYAAAPASASPHAPSPGRSQLACLVDTVAGEFRPQAAAKALALETGIGAGLERACICAPSPVQRALSVLVDNAVKYTEQGGVRIACAARPDGGLAIEVSDTGAGMSPELARAAFEPFRRGDASRTTTVDGLGLGLSLADRLIREIGGRITLHTAPGAGVQACIVLPASACANVVAGGRGAASQADRRIA